MRKLSNITFKVTHQGQALVEYAILLFLLVTLFVGGTELGLTALASNKNTEAAKTGISEYAEVNQQRINILNAQNQHLTSLSSYNCRKISNNSDTLGVCDLAGSVDNYVFFLDSVYEGVIADFNLDDAAQNLFNEVENVDNPTNPINSPSKVINQLPNTGNTLLDLALGEDVILKSEIPLSNSEVEGQIKFRALILINYYKLTQLPLLTDINRDGEIDVGLSQAKINIGISNARLQPPSCNGNTYDEGFPTDLGFRRYLYAKYKDATNNDQTYQTGDVVYLFNPLPINVTSCIGVDEERDGLPRIRILIDGYTPTPAKLVASGKSFEQLFVPGLPKLNQAMYSNYENVCVNDTNNYVSCTNINVVQRWLKPPGKICFSNTEIVGVDSCIGQPNTDLEAPDNTYGPTGFYFFGNPNDSAQGNFEYTQNQAPEFRPAIQVECSATPNSKSDQVIDTNCSSTPSKLRIHTRYRRVFDGFLSFGLMRLTQQELLPYFYNPSLVGVNGTTVVGSYGSEVGPLSSLNGPPTIKHFMDFRGCYEVDVETNQISACN